MKKNTKILSLIILITLITYSTFYFLNLRKLTVLTQLSTTEDLHNKANIFLCGENYSTNEIYINKKPITKDLLESTFKKGYNFCTDPKSETNNTLAVNKINENLINVIYRDVKYEYIIDKDLNVFIINDYDESVTEILNDSSTPKLNADKMFREVKVETR